MALPVLSSQEQKGTSAATKLPAAEILLCRIRLLHKAVYICCRCVYTLIHLFQASMDGELNLCHSAFSPTATAIVLQPGLRP